MKKVLIVTYYYPPSGDSGAQRWLYFSKYMRDFGVDATVVSVDPKFASFKRVDEKLCEEIDHLKVIRTKSFELLSLYSYLKSGKKKAAIPQGEVDTKKGVFTFLSRFVRGSLMIPDARKGWAKYAYKAAKKEVEKGMYDLLITSGPPHSTHLVGKRLKSEFPDLLWMSDFRDPWTDIFYYNDFIRTNSARKKDKALEKEILQKSDFVLSVGPSLIELLKEKVPAEMHHKFHTVTNGFDKDKMDAVAPLEKDQKVWISHIGILGSHQPYDLFLEAMSGVSAKKEIQLNLVGALSEYVIKDFRKLQNVDIHTPGVVNHKEAISYMKASNLLLLFLPRQKESKLMITGKLMEYAYTGNPILLIGDTESDGAKLIKDRTNVYAFEDNKNNIPDITAALTEIFERGQHLDTSFEKYSRKSTTKELCAIIKDITTS